MIKKRISAYLLVTALVISCTSDNNEIIPAENTSSKSELYGRISNSPENGFPVFLGIGSSPEIENIITVNPFYQYYGDFNVYAGDSNYSVSTPNCLGDGKPCINLSRFLGMYGAYTASPDYNPLTAARFPIFYAYMGMNDFKQYPKPAGINYTLETSFQITERGSFSPLFANSSYMTNDAANSVLHQFKNLIGTIPNDSQGRQPKVFAAHFQYNSWFGDPPYREAKMSVRYYY
jgi:hypothetical protein